MRRRSAFILAHISKTSDVFLLLKYLIYLQNKKHTCLQVCFLQDEQSNKKLPRMISQNDNHSDKHPEESQRNTNLQLEKKNTKKKYKEDEEAKISFIKEMMVCVLT
jgi:hypothetical protein